MRLDCAAVSEPCTPRPASMRKRRSAGGLSFATTRITPSSTPLRPSFHSSATRMLYCSMASGAVLGISKTAIWLPVRSSYSRSTFSRALRCSGCSMPAMSLTCPFKGGTATNSCACANRHSSASMNAGRQRNCFIRRVPAYIADYMCCLFTEIDGGRGRNAFLVFDRERGMHLVAEHLGRQVGRKAARERVVFLHALDVALACDRNPVFGAFELRLQIAEAGIRIQLRIVFRDRHQSRPRRGQFALHLLEFLEGLRIVQHFGRDLKTGGGGTGAGDRFQRLSFVRSITLDGIDQIWN